MNSHDTHIRCEFENVGVISQIVGANLNGFNLLRLLY